MEDNASKPGDGPLPRIGTPIEGMGAAGSARKPELERPIDVEPIPLEEPEPAPPPAARARADSKVKELDICPNCGASMRGAEELVCLRCGFDLKTLKVVKTVTGDAAAKSQDEDEEEELDAVPLVQPGLGDLWLPGIIAGVSAAILIVSYLAGSLGLFPHLTSTEGAATAEIPLGARFEGLLQFVVLSAMWIACGIGALAFLAYLIGKPFGDLKLALVRMTAIVVTMRLASLIDFTNRTWEWMAEATLQAAIFIGLSIALFRLPPRDAPTLAIAAVILFMVLWLGANVVVWVTM